MLLLLICTRMDVRGNLTNVMVCLLEMSWERITEYIIASIYRVPLQTPAVMARELKMRADKLATVMQDVEIKHPLVSCSIISCLTSTMLIDNCPDICTGAIPHSCIESS